MRICFVIHQATKEGTGRFLLDQIDYLKRKNVFVSAILPASGPLCDALAERGIEFKIVHHPWWTKDAFGNQAREIVFTLSAARLMANYFREWNVEIVYTQTIVAPAGALAAIMAGIPHVWHIHEFAYNPECIEMGIPRAALAQLLNLSSNLIVFNSAAVAAEWEGLLPGGKAKIVRNWVSQKSVSAKDAPASGFAVDPARFNIAMVASVLPWKRQMDAVRAAALLVRGNFNITLLIIGPTLNDKYRDEILDFIRENNLEDRVQLPGFLENPQSVVKLCQASVVCSNLEPFGRTTVESMFNGVPVVGANSGGTPEIIEDEVSGLLYPVGEVDALAGRLRRLIQNEGLRQELSKNAIKRAGEFSSAENEMEPLIALLSSMAGTQNPLSPLGEILAAPGSAEFRNVHDLGIFEHCHFLRKKMARRIGGLIFGK